MRSLLDTARMVCLLLSAFSLYFGLALQDITPVHWTSDQVSCPANKLAVIEKAFYNNPLPEVCDSRCRRGPKATSADLCYFLGNRQKCVQRAPDGLVWALYNTCQPSPSYPTTCNVMALGHASLTVGYSCLLDAIFDPFKDSFSWKDYRVAFSVGLRDHNVTSRPRQSKCTVQSFSPQVPRLRITVLQSPATAPPPAAETPTLRPSVEPSFVTSSAYDVTAPSTGPDSREEATSPSAAADNETTVTSRKYAREAETVVEVVVAGGARQRVEGSLFPRWWLVEEKEFQLLFTTQGGSPKRQPFWLLLEDSEHQHSLEVRCETKDVVITTTAKPRETTSVTSPRETTAWTDVTHRDLSPVPPAKSFSLLELTIAVTVAVLGVAGLALILFFLLQRGRRRNDHILANAYETLLPAVRFPSNGPDSVAVVSTAADVQQLSREDSSCRRPPTPCCQPQEIVILPPVCATSRQGGRACVPLPAAPRPHMDDDDYLQPVGSPGPGCSDRDGGGGNRKTGEHEAEGQRWEEGRKGECDVGGTGSEVTDGSDTYEEIPAVASH